MAVPTWLVSRDTGGGQGGQGQSLLVAAGRERSDLGLGAEETGVGSGLLLGGQEPGHQIGAPEAPGIGAQCLGVEDEQRELARSVGSARRHVLVDVRLQVGEPGSGHGQVLVGRRQGQHALRGGGEVGLVRTRRGRNVALRG